MKCSKCLQDKIEAEFYRVQKYKRGYSYKCKECEKAIHDETCTKF